MCNKMHIKMPHLSTTCTFLFSGTNVYLFPPVINLTVYETNHIYFYRWKDALKMKKVKINDGESQTERSRSE